VQTITRDDGNIHTAYRSDLDPLAILHVGDQVVVETAPTTSRAASGS
jgi:hypothetical protein